MDLSEFDGLCWTFAFEDVGVRSRVGVNFKVWDKAKAP